ncbi:MAG: hypothetical protein MUF87_20100 [Anaerolineae bacterium]|jgi:hypothetical protein|nr:hypothetical protein [Anaerolineae bacterium]
MLEITESTPRRLVLVQTRPTLTFLAVVFTGFSGCSLILILVQSVQIALADPQVLGEISWVISVGTFWLIGVGLVIFGVIGCWQIAQGVRLTFDKDAESVVLQRARRQNHHSIYGVLRLEAERNELARAYGLFLVLRSGERIAITAVPEGDRDQLEHLLQTVRHFLQSA